MSCGTRSKTQAGKLSDSDALLLTWFTLLLFGRKSCHAWKVGRMLTMFLNGLGQHSAEASHLPLQDLNMNPEIDLQVWRHSPILRPARVAASAEDTLLYLLEWLPPTPSGPNPSNFKLYEATPTSRALGAVTFLPTTRRHAAVLRRRT